MNGMLFLNKYKERHDSPPNIIGVKFKVNVNLNSNSTSFVFFQRVYFRPIFGLRCLLYNDIWGFGLVIHFL